MSWQSVEESSIGHCLCVGSRCNDCRSAINANNAASIYDDDDDGGWHGVVKAEVAIVGRDY